MNIKRIGIFIMIALFLFGCKPEPGTQPENGDGQQTGGNPTSIVTVTFNMNGGIPNYTAVNVVKGSTFGLQYPPAPAKNGFIFGGWYAENDASYSNEYTRTTVINDNITLKARWFTEYTITFNTDGGSAAPSDIKIAEGSSMGDKYPPVPTKAGNTFAGWYNNETKYEKNTPVNSSLNLKAKWTAGDPPTFTVTFAPDNGEPNFTKDVPQGAIIGAQFPSDPVKEEYVFNGWYNGNTRYYDNTAITAAITLTAKWTSSAIEVNNWKGISVSSGVTAAQYDSLKGKTDVLYLKPSGDQYTTYSVMSYSLTSFIGKEITITLSMDVLVDNPAKIAWQINNGSAAADAWGGAWKVVAGSNADGSEISKDTWVHLSGTAAGTPASGNNNGNVLYLSGGGSGGQLETNPVGIYFANLVLTITDSTVSQPDPDVILLTVGDKIDLRSKLNAVMNGTITWSSSDSTKVSVDTSGIVTSNLTSFTAAEGGNQKYTEGSAKAQVTITATAGANTQTFKVAAATEGQTNIMDMPPFKDYFPASILAGNIATGSDAGASSITNMALTRHFNALTPENDMKPNAVSNGRNTTTGAITYTWTNADRFVNAAYNSGFKVIGHTLLWHSQIPTWQTNMAAAGKETALAAMKKFITEVMDHYKGKIYSWDVLNEAFPDSGYSSTSDWKAVMRQENPWYKAIGSDFVYEAYLAARAADPDAKLYYNDYNTDQTGKATMIRDMVRDVNNKYKTEYPNETRLLIEGIGMQEHHNTGVSASNIRNTLTMFKAIGVKVSVTEIDVLGQDWSSFSSVGQGGNKHASSTVTNNGLLTQASLYGQYMAVYMEFKDIIERISIWGVTDNNSWRSAGLPLLFDSNGRAKPAYYKFAGAVTK